jgi:hypothetical protein
MKKHNYRFDQYGSVYEYNIDHGAYLFIGRLNGRSKKAFIAAHERDDYCETDCNCDCSE